MIRRPIANAWASSSSSSFSNSKSSQSSSSSSTTSSSPFGGDQFRSGETKSKLLELDVNIRALPWKLTLQIMRDTAAGMEYLHLHQPIIIHRDLKSQNLLLDKSWTTKVADFGISRVKGMTATMTRIGTPQWMAPEVLREEKYSEKADIWSYGVVLWELVTLRPPFDGVSPLAVIYNVANQLCFLFETQELLFVFEIH